MPNIFETSPHVIKAVFSAIEGCRIACGVGKLLQYIYQGLFHAARKVREPYWKIYNNCYVYNQDGMVPFLPRLTDDEGMQQYEKSYLDLFI